MENKGIGVAQIAHNTKTKPIHKNTQDSWNISSF